MITARDILLERSQPDANRTQLQQIGQALETKTGGRWLLDAVKPQTGGGPLIVDSARTLAQGLALIAEAGAQLAYLTAAVEERRRRYESRGGTDPLDIGLPFSKAETGEVALETERLRVVAGVEIDTTDQGVNELALAVIETFGLDRRHD